MVSDDSGALHYSIQRSLVDPSSNSNEAVSVHVFWGVQLWGRSCTFKIQLTLAGFFNITNPSFNSLVSLFLKAIFLKFIVCLTSLVRQIWSCDSTCSQQRAAAEGQILLQPLKVNLSEGHLVVLYCSFVSIPFQFGDESLRFWSDPCQCLQVQGYEVFSIITILTKTNNISSLIIPLTSVHLL